MSNGEGVPSEAVMAFSVQVEFERAQVFFEDEADEFLAIVERGKLVVGDEDSAIGFVETADHGSQSVDALRGVGIWKGTESPQAESAEDDAVAAAP